jgi:hypothetical protein
MKVLLYYGERGEMSKSELASKYVNEYLTSEMDRHTFIKVMAGLGVSTVAASVFAFTANPAFATDNGKNGNNGKHKGHKKGKGHKKRGNGKGKGHKHHKHD